MAYAETSDLNLSDQRLIELTDSSAAPGEVDEDLLDGLLVESQSLVDGILAPAVDVPFADDSVPPLITVITSWIWTYRIYRHREVMEIPKSVVEDYQMAIQMLKDIVSGELSLGDDVEDTNSPVPSVLSSCPRGWTTRSRWET